MKTMRCEVELYNEGELIYEEFEVEVLGHCPTEDYVMIEEIIEELLFARGYTVEDLEEYEIGFTLGSF